MTRQFSSFVFIQRKWRYVHTKICMWKFIAAWFITTPNRKQPKCLLTGESVNNFWCIHKIEYDPCGSDGKQSACNAGNLGSIPASGRSVEKGMANQFSILVWGIPWTKEPGRLESTGLKESDMTEWLTLFFFFTAVEKEKLFYMQQHGWFMLCKRSQI